MNKDYVRGRVGRYVGLFVVLAPLAIAAMAVFVYLVMRLWNWLVPGLFGLPSITYWQMLGILVLSKILFGGFPAGGRSRGGSRHGRLRMLERWEQMTPEERERFRQGLRGHGCGHEPARPTP